MEKLVRRDSVAIQGTETQQGTPTLAAVLQKEITPEFVKKIEDNLLFCDHIAFGFLVFDNCDTYAANAIPAVKYYESQQGKPQVPSSGANPSSGGNSYTLSWKRLIISPWSKIISDKHVLNARIIEALCLLEHHQLLEELGVSQEVFQHFVSDTFTYLPAHRKALFRLIDQLAFQEGQQLIKRVQIRYFQQIGDSGRRQSRMSHDLSIFKYLEIPVSICLGLNILDPEYEILSASLVDIGKENLCVYLPRKRAIESVSLASTRVMSSDASSAICVADLPLVPRFDMTKPGKCIIINQKTFNRLPEDPQLYQYRVENLEDRLGTDYDCELLQHTFSSLNCEVTVRQDMTSRDLRVFFQNMSRSSFSDVSVLVVCILSHGKEGNVFGTDGVPVPLRELKENFTATRCPSLAEKPKLFFMQACQGEDSQVGFKPSDLRTDGAMGSVLIPDISNFYEAWSTVRGYVSYRSTSSGSWFVRTLCHYLLLHGHTLDVKAIMTLVTDNVAHANAGSHKQVPQVCDDCLRKQVIFCRNEESFLDTVVWKLTKDLCDQFVKAEVDEFVRGRGS